MNAEPEPTRDDAETIDRRDRLLAVLLRDDPSLVLVRCDEDEADLVGTNAELRIHVDTIAKGMSPAALTKRVKRAVAKVAQFGSPTHFVAIGGGPEVASALKSSAPYVQQTVMGFHHVDDAGRVALVAGKRFDRIDDVAPRLAETAPLSPDELASAIARGEAVVAKERAVVSKLKGRYTVTALITAVCIALTAMSYVWGGSDALNSALWRMGADRGDSVVQGEWYRLFAGAFLHANFLHLLLNMAALWSFGPILEALLGRRRYILLYAASALGGSIASAMIRPERWSVGASGAIWGLMAAGFAVAMRPRGLLPQSMVLQMRKRVIAPLALNLVYSFQPGVDLLAHLGGGVVGFALAATLLTNGLTPVEARNAAGDAEAKTGPLGVAFSAIAVAAMSISIVMAILTGRPWTVLQAPTLKTTAVGDHGVSLDLPEDIADQVQRTDHEKVTVYTYGKFPGAVMVFEVIDADLKGEVPPEQLDKFLDKERAALDEHALPKAVRKGQATRIQLGARPAVEVEHTIDTIHLKTVLVVVGHHEVLVRGYSMPSRPASWNGLEEKVATTIAVH